MYLRFISSSSFAIIVTAALLLMMAGLITQQRGQPRSRPPIDTSIWHDVVRELPPLRTIEPPKRPPEVSDPPVIPRIDDGPAEGIRVATGGSLYEPPTGADRIPLGIPDGELMALVLVAPAYPAAALRRNLEGYVIVMFSVTASGSVDNIRVTESSDTVFERAAVEAARKFRFRPRVIDGTPVAVDAVRRRITFSLED